MENRLTEMNAMMAEIVLAIDLIHSLSVARLISMIRKWPGQLGLMSTSRPNRLNRKVKGCSSQLKFLLHFAVQFFLSPLYVPETK